MSSFKKNKYSYYRNLFRIKALILLLLIFLASGCKKFVTVNAPANSITGTNVYTSDATAAAVLTGLYAKMSAGSFATGGSSISIEAGLSADELSLYSGSSNSLYKALYLNALTSQLTQTYWQTFYQYLLTVNSALEGLAISTSLTPSIRQQLQGEAKFMRAFIYFYLVNLYGDVPLVNSKNYEENISIPRTSKSQIYQQIILDLKDAQILLNSNYVAADGRTATIDRVRPSKWAATALLARVYLYIGDWVDAEDQATLVINNSSLFNLSSLTNSFKKNSSEAIWQLQPVNAGWNTEDARVFILPPTGPNNGSQPVYASSFLLNSFEPSDQRAVNWIGTRIVGPTLYYYPNKYQSATSGASVTEYLMVLRLAEQYLIRAEARTKKASVDFTGAKADIDSIRHRAGLPYYSGSQDATSFMTAIMHERQVELFSEWGHRWLDLKRTGAIDSIMNVVTPQKGGVWSTNWQLYPIPINDILKNVNLVQNPGY